MEEIARKPKCDIFWNGKNITADISPYVSSISYTDREESESDELTIVVDDSEGLWASAWYPEEGDTLRLVIGYDDEMVDSGLFQVDELVFSGPPEQLEIKAIAAGISTALRSRNSKAFEGLTLRQIAQFFCKKHNLTLIDESNFLSKINLDRKTQEEKTDLQFLSDLASEYGFIFSVRGDKMIFTSYFLLDNAESVKSIDKSILSNYSFTEKTYDTYKSAKLLKRDSKKSLLVEVRADWESEWDVAKTDDTLLVKGNATTSKQAELKVKAGLWRRNKYRYTGSLILVGDPNLVSGVNINITGARNMSGKYHITESTHTMSGDGEYSTSIEIRKCGSIPSPLAVPKQVEPKAEFDANNDDYSKLFDSEVTNLFNDK